ncbi:MULTISPECIES: DUF2079 domain-containing protein [unclassified Streptomyces]|uniref:DUF2079 domain-containing protein n=1 Tax=unclassified Streptomyces TaxID=2593676 RepID=UPI002367071D|nr:MULTISPECIES: DUF2079 domain-containing protein [unclassified Streptomyces]MDF3144379.1 DUF2079 domain-containing protein [Streptomyces sp. T21Q-yed]WDF38684.1 DUF2079 domain-containing protein [Streptomyces sp. T12]
MPTPATSSTPNTSSDPHIPAPATPPDGQARPAPARREPWLLAAALFVGYAIVSVGRYRHLGQRSWDLGIFEQVIRSYAHLQAPIADLKGPGFNILGDHFSPVTALLAPLYRVFPSPVTLLVAQAALFALSAVPVTRAAARLLGRWRGLAIGVAYGLSWGLQQAVDFDFHEICFAVPLIAFSLEALLARRWRAALLWAIPLVLVKEDLGFTLTGIALVVAWRARRGAPRASRYAIGVAVFGVVAVAATLLLVIPSFNSAGTYDYWNKVSESSGGGGPFDGLDTKFRTLCWLLIPTTGLLALRSPVLLVALPTIGWRFVSSYPQYWGTDWHYSAVLMPIVFLALVDALDTARHSTRAWLRSYVPHLPAAVAAASLALTTSLPLAALTESEIYRKPARVTAIERLLAQVPDNASVEANIAPISRLTSRCRVFWVSTTRGINPDFIALDNSRKRYRDVEAYAEALHPDARYTVKGTAYGVVLLERQSGPGQSGPR